MVVLLTLLFVQSMHLLVLRFYLTPLVLVLMAKEVVEVVVSVLPQVLPLGLGLEEVEEEVVGRSSLWGIKGSGEGGPEFWGSGG